MSRLPDLEQSLLRAALRLDQAAAVASALTTPWWRRRRGVLVLTILSSLLIASGAVAAVALLDTGDPVPGSRDLTAILGEVKPGSSVVLPLRVADPDGGPPWALELFRVAGREAQTSALGPGVCVRAARSQNGRLGVVGRDGVFGNDGKFHALQATSSQGSICQAGSLNQTNPQRSLQGLRSQGPPIPASGYTGKLTTPVGGCIEHALNPATTSPQTRRKLRGLPICPAGDARIVTYGFTDPSVVSVRYANDKVTRRMKPTSEGAYLFVIRAGDAGSRRFALTLTYRDGTTCTTKGNTGQVPIQHDCLGR